MISFREIKISDAEKILNWRTKKRVTKYMITDVDFNMDQQIKWLKESTNKKDYYHWIIQYKSVDIGVISISNYDSVEKKSSLGLYIGSDEHLGLGAFVPLYFYNFAFNILGITEIQVKIFFDNINTIKLHLLHGYKFTPCRDRVIIKNSKDVLLVGMTLTKDAFMLKKKTKYIAEFPMLNWKC